MRVRSNIGRGVIIATISAGPIFMLTIAGMELFLSSRPTRMFDGPDLISGLVILLLLTCVYGMMLAIVPCLLGTAVMLFLGRTNAAMRLPVMWALVGGLASATPFLATSRSTSDSSFALGIIITGTLAALICRKGATWTDEPLP